MFQNEQAGRYPEGRAWGDRGHLYHLPGKGDEEQVGDPSCLLIGCWCDYYLSIHQLATAKGVLVKTLIMNY